MKYPDDLKVTLINGDCLDKLKELEDNSVDSIVTDPPYGLSFMGKKWDYDVPSEDIWRECLRVLKPGGHLLAFAGTRTQHRMAVRIEDAGFEIRDMIAWIYGSGFPKSLNIGKAVDKLQGNEREVVGNNGVNRKAGGTFVSDNEGVREYTKGTSEWEGWGTALKPALEPITVARKPLIGTVAENVLTHGTGGLNIDGCRVEGEINPKDYGRGGGWAFRGDSEDAPKPNTQGRFPANLIHDGSEEVVRLFPDGAKPKPERRGKKGGSGFGFFDDEKTAATDGVWPADPGGSAARFFKSCEYDTIEALWRELESQDHFASSVVNQFVSCETLTAEDIAEIKTWASNLLVSLRTLASIGNFKNSTQLQNLVSSVENLANTDTTQTTASLLKLFGSVLLAIGANTSSDNTEKEVADSDQEKETISRIIYQAKASKKDRDNEGAVKNSHATVKPTDLMRYLCRLVTPPGGIVLDPFMGSGSTGKAAYHEGFSFIGIEMDEEYVEIAKARIGI